ncbi:S41 family peptidase [Sandarakinorhabdus oryzae]|uniref:S41 family peptidase n=1 Tax=Sandarakinorhabdus oryzae TaxID=2675220 RepID=UPI001F27FBDE|nr:S41 family peptidase [Sandarakinorhabdus oryzae]
MRSALSAAVCAAVLLAGCSGGGSPSPSPSPTPTPTPTAQCTLRDRQLWAEAQIREWYLFPDDLPASLDPAPYATVQAYIDALTATSRAAGKDRFFTYITSIAEENAFLSSGQTAAFGIRLDYDDVARRVFILDVFETSPAFAAGFDRGAEILAIGTTPDSLVPVPTLFAQGGAAAVSDALGPSQAGVTRTIRFTLNGTERTVTVSKADFAIPPVSPRFGVQLFDEPGIGKVGYVNLRSFISPAETPLRNAFANFRSQGATRIIVDFRYNGGGLVSVAELMGDLMGQNRRTSDVFSFTTYRTSKAASNSTRNFRIVPEAVGPTDLVFIGTAATASASELVINSMLPYFQNHLTLVGGNTTGKPVGQIAVDRTACDDRLRIVAFATQNASRQGDYYTGLVPYLPSRGGAVCEAADQYSQPIGRTEESVSIALSTLAGVRCPTVNAAGLTAAGERAVTRQALLARAPSAAQRDMPGTF